MSEGKKKIFLTFNQQFEVVKKIKAGVPREKIIRDYGICDSTFYRLVNRERKILKNLNNLELFNRKTTKQSNEKVLDAAVLTWFQQLTDRGDPVNGPIIQEKARIFNERLNGPATFKASNGWLDRFKRRYAIKIDKLSNDFETARQFSSVLKEKMEFENLSWGNIYNADEAGVYWQTIKSCIFNDDSEEEVPPEGSEDRVTALFCSNASGSHRIPLLIIGTTELPKYFDNSKSSEINDNQLQFLEGLGVIYTCQSSSWMKRHIFMFWYKEIFIPRVLEHQKMNGITGKVILLMDSASSHPNLQELNSVDSNFEIMCLVPTVRSVIQPMEQGLVAATKKLYKTNMLRHLLVNDKTQGADTFLRNLNLPDCFSLLSNAWNNIKLSSLQKAWKPLLGEALNNIEDPLLIDNPQGSMTYLEEETLSFPYEMGDQLFQLLSGPKRSIERSKEMLIKWFETEKSDCGWEPMSDEDIIESVKTKKEEEGERATEFIAVRSIAEENEYSLVNPESQEIKSDPFKVTVTFEGTTQSSFVKNEKTKEKIQVPKQQQVKKRRKTANVLEKPKESEFKEVKEEIEENQNCIQIPQDVRTSSVLRSLITIKEWMKSSKKVRHEHHTLIKDLENVIVEEMSESSQNQMYLTL